MAKLTLDALDFAGRRVLVRVDFNVPLDGDGDAVTITDDTRIRAALPTIRTITGDGGTAILMSHLGRPKGAPDPAYSLRPVADHLAGLIDVPVAFSESTVGDEAERVIAEASRGSVVLLENTRFHAGETANDADFAKQLAALGEVYVNDAFGAAHRAHASTVGVTEHVGQSAMGTLLQREVEALGAALGDPERPFVAVLGGAKVSDKIGVIRALLGSVDRLLIGGAMSYTFLKALGHDVGDSKVEDDRLDEAFAMYDGARDQIVLPADHVVAGAFDNDAPRRVVTGEIRDGMALDIGPSTRAQYRSILKGAKTILWNGPMGVFEMSNFADGTNAVAEAIVEATEANGALSLVGGGDSVAAVTQGGYADAVSHVSTGGGAMLEFIEGDELPGIAALSDR
ncbi:MAG: phosphoglycerate kinase [Bacteroidota bacterium]